jgi:peptidoglycan/LPS O-acetylase OafA/YrhL
MYHALPNIIKAGFIGVDIFFVISGFLITSIILKNINNHSFSFIEFYSRRIKRIFPALITILITSLLLGYFFLFSDEFKQLARHIVRVTEFTVNFTFAKKTGYFEDASAVKPLLHLWSLAVEEQFYIFWPAIIWISFKKNINLKIVILSLLFISFAININQILKGHFNYFYLPQSRSWELLLGSLLAYIKIQKLPTNKKYVNWADLFNWLGPILILTGLFLINESKPYPYYWALLPTLGSLLILNAPKEFWFNKFILSNHGLVWFGLISYPLYLWHWPLLSFAQIIHNGTPSIEIKIFLVALSILLAWATYKFIEAPLRKNQKSVAGLIFVSILIGFVAYKIERNNGLYLFNQNVEKISRAIVVTETPGDDLQYTNFEGKHFYYLNSSNPQSILFLGDSNIDQYYPRLKYLIKNDPAKTSSIFFSSGGGCLPLEKITFNSNHQHCNDLASKTLNFIAMHKQITAVVIGANWNSYLINGSNLDGKFGYKSEKYLNTINELNTLIEKIKSLNKKVILVLNIPTHEKLNPKNHVKREISNFPNIFKLEDNTEANLNEINSKYGGLRKDLIQVAHKSNIRFIDPLDYLCHQNTCPSQYTNGLEIYKDSSHLNVEFVRNYASFIDKTITKQ